MSTTLLARLFPATAPRSPAPGAAAAATEGDDDQALLARFRGGERGALDALLLRHQRGVFALARRFLRDDEEAKDVAQRALLAAIEGAPGFRGDASFRSWLYRIALNLAQNAQRDRRRRPEAPAAALRALPAEAGPGGEGRLLQAERRAQLRAAIAALPPKQRLVVELRLFDELPFREVAQVTGGSEESAKMNFHHALRRLGELMKGGAP